MKIHTNSFGNYNPIKTQITAAINQNQEVKNDLKITNEEKNFFTKLYPNQKDTIENYHFYDKKGDINGNSLGSLFDRRG
jgi:hypothetical protein